VKPQFEALKSAYVLISTDYLKLYTKYVALLDQKQQKGFWEKFDETTADFKRRTFEEQEEKLEDRFEMFFGEVTTPQSKLLKDHARYQMSHHEESLKERQLLRDHLKVIFAQNLSSEEKAKAFSQVYLNYQNGLLDNEMTIGLIKSIIPTLTNGQRKFFKKLTTEIEDLIVYFLTKNF
jgi:hypothetical protein